MTEWEKAQNGYLYDANYDKEIVDARTRCADLCYEFNNCKPSDLEKQNQLLTQIFGSIKGTPIITAPFYCDYGFNISVGKNFYTNHSVTILDGAKVIFGDNVWIRTNVSVLPGVTIGKNTIIGAGSVVNKSIPENVIAAGNPCRVIRKITEADKKKYPVFDGDIESK